MWYDYNKYMFYPEEQLELIPEMEFLNETGISAPRILTYTTKDVIDNRISIPAQHSLVRLSKNPATNADAIGILEEIKAGKLGGIYCVNWKIPAQRALKFGKTWWTVIPQGEDAILMLDPDNPLIGQPIIVLRRELDPNCGLLQNEKKFMASPQRIDAALLKSWGSYKLWRSGQIIKCSTMPTSDPVFAELEFPALPLLSNIAPPLFCNLKSSKSHLVKYEAVDVLQKNINNPKSEVSFDDGQTWRTLTIQEKLKGFNVGAGSKFVARVSVKGLWPVEQRFILQPPLETVNPIDFGTLKHSSGQTNHLFTTKLTLLRDAEPDRINLKIPPLPDYRFDILSFEGKAVLSNDKKRTGFERFAAHIVRSIVPHGPNGKVFFAKAHSSSFPTPQLVAVFVPTGLDLKETVPVHIFFTPYTHIKKPPYPYGPDWNAMIDNYMVNKGKRFLQQHAASGRKCIFVFPVAPPKEYFQAIDSGSKLCHYLFELVYWLQRMNGLHKTSIPRLGRCAISGFSAGGNPLVSIMNTSMNREFPELMEVYGFDVANKDSFSSVSSRWWNNGQRIVRWYNHYSNVKKPGYAKDPPQMNAGALEYSGNNSTYLYTPLSFWETVCKESGKNNDTTYECATLSRPVNDSEVHQMMPCIFMQHALKNSGFPI